MLACFQWCTSLLRCGGNERRPRGHGRRRGRAAFDDNAELIEYDELRLDVEGVRPAQVAEAARVAESRQIAPALRDESLVARLTHSLNSYDPSSAMVDESAMEDDEDALQLKNSDSSTSVPSAENFVRTLRTLPDAKVRKVVVEALWNATRHRWRKRETTRMLSLFQLAVAQVLSPTSQQELFSIIQDLPPAVMGDDVAQQSSRVLIDVPHDVREEMMRKRAELPAASRLQVDSAVTAFDAQLRHIELTGAQWELDRIILRHPASKPFKPGSIDPHIALYFDILISLLLEVEEFDRFRILLSQIILSKQIPSDNTLRVSVLELVFPSRPPTPATPTQLLIDPSQEASSSIV